MFNINPNKYPPDNLLSEQEVGKKVEELKKQGKKVGFCSGSFDLLHAGHITHLESAKKLCDVLIVSVARDTFSSKKHQGKGRPVFSHEIRAFMISKLKAVDFVIFDNGQIDILKIVKPSIYIKGKDYADVTVPNIINQKKMMEELGGEIVFTDDEKLATTDIINYIKKEVEY